MLGVLNLRVNDQEAAELDRLRRATGRSCSDLVRDALWACPACVADVVEPPDARVVAAARTGWADAFVSSDQRVLG